MEGDPYSMFFETIRKDREETSSAAYRIGNVVTGAPLSVDIGGALQKSSALVLNSPLPYLGVAVEEADGHNHAAHITNASPAFAPGDELLLLPIEEEQRYIVMGKLVGL